MKNIRQRFTGMRFIAPALAAALAAAFAIGGAIGFTYHRQPQSLIPAASASNGMNGMAALTMSFAPIVKNAQPAVVSIASTKVVKISGDEGLSPLFDDPMFRQFFGDGPQNRFGKQREQREQGLGSGVIVSPDGYILTNNHVIDAANEIRVYTSDKRELKARVIGADGQTNLRVGVRSRAGILMVRVHVGISGVGATPGREV